MGKEQRKIGKDTFYDVNLFILISYYLLHELIYFRTVDRLVIVVIADYSMEAYDLLFKLMYGEVNYTSELDVNLLFQVYGLAQKYLIVDELFQLIKDGIEKYIVRKDNLIPAIKIVNEYKELDGFQEMAEGLMAKVAEKTIEQLSDFVAFSTFYTQHIKNNPDELATLMKAISSCKSTKCHNCLEPLVTCKNGKPLPDNVKPHTGLKFKSWYAKGVHTVVSVVARNERTKEGDMMYDVTWTGGRTGQDRCWKHTWIYPNDENIQSYSRNGFKFKFGSSADSYTYFCKK